MSAADPYGLQRFLAAQDEGATYERALAELRAGRKRSHWMWFIFPQVEGLGRSPVAQHYAIGSLDEARAFLEHPVLGRRLIETAQALVELQAHDAGAVLGGIDAMKLRSSMTLFSRVAPEHGVFRAVLEQYFGGLPDEATERLLQG